jgi:RNA polymerase sigma factor (sigma-70 family)
MRRQRERFWELLEPIYTEAEVFCRKLAGDREQGDDLFQDALVTGFRKFSGLRDESSFRPWLYRIIVRTFVSTVRRPWWKRRVRLTPDLEQFLPSVDPIERHTARRWLDRAFQAVSPEDQALVTLYELEEWTIKELAEVQGKTEGAVKLRLFRARRKMREAIRTFLSRAERSREADKTTEGAATCAAAKPDID